MNRRHMPVFPSSHTLRFVYQVVKSLGTTELSLETRCDTQSIPVLLDIVTAGLSALLSLNIFNGCKMPADDFTNVLWPHIVSRDDKLVAGYVSLSPWTA